MASSSGPPESDRAVNGEESSDEFPAAFGSVLKGLGFTAPTPIQASAWRAVLAGQDVVGVAKTGSGKTLAYALPTVYSLNGLRAPTDNGGKGECVTPLALCLVPARELGLQVAREFKRSAKYSGSQVSIGFTCGGIDRTEQLSDLREIQVSSNRPVVLVSTPGRLLDFVNGGEISLARVRVAIVDEVDRMFAMGFIAQLREIRSHLPNQSVGAPMRVMLFTATKSDDLERECKEWTNSPARVGDRKIKADDRKINPNTGALFDDQTNAPKLVVPAGVTQIVHVCANHKKPRKLIKLLARLRREDASTGGRRARQPTPVLVFCNRIKTVEFVWKLLVKTEARAAKIHGRMPQEMRLKALRGFRAGKSRVLVATNVAARGLDIKNLSAVVNYDFPGSLEEYVHRVGRTGRASGCGTAWSFFTRNFAKMAPSLVELLKSGRQTLDPNLVALAKAESGAATRSAIKRPLKGRGGGNGTLPGGDDGDMASLLGGAMAELAAIKAQKRKKREQQIGDQDIAIDTEVTGVAAADNAPDVVARKKRKARKAAPGVQPKQKSRKKKKMRAALNMSCGNQGNGK